MSRGRPFEVGNTFGKGRPRGSKNRGTSAARRLLEEHVLPLTTKNIAEGLKENTKSRHYCLDELKPVPPRAPRIKLPAIKTFDDIERALDIVLSAVANCKCTAAHGQALCAMLGERRKMIETHELAPRLEQLEALVRKLGCK
jgi:hypothetical protein